ncbi:MAG TPA: YncE family protein [Bryobacteraceae bacterium]|nr:YncE family protein [Bryobacteraceae bacterium]
MKLKLIEAAVLLAILVFVLDCGALPACLDPTRSTWTTCGYNPTTDKYVINTHDVDWNGEDTIINQQEVDFDCKPSDNGEGGPQTSQNTADTIPSSTGTHASSPGARVHPSSAPISRRDSGGSGSTAGGFLPVQWLNLPFTAIAPSSASAPPACDASQPDIVVVNHAAGTLTRMGTCPLAVKASIPLVSRPLQVVVTPDGKQAVVSNFDNYVTFVNLQNNTVLQNVNTPGMNPAGVAVSPDGKTAYVCSFSATAPAVMVFDIPSRTMTATIPLNTQWPHSVSVTPDGAQLYVAFSDNDEVDIIDTLTKTDFAALNIPAPEGIDFSPTGTVAYIGSGGTNSTGSLVALDTKTLKTIKTYTVGSYPTDVRVMYGGAQVVVTNYLSNSISVVNTATGQVKTTSFGSGSPMGLARVR